MSRVSYMYGRAMGTSVPHSDIKSRIRCFEIILEAISTAESCYKLARTPSYPYVSEYADETFFTNWEFPNKIKNTNTNMNTNTITTSKNTSSRKLIEPARLAHGRVADYEYIRSTIEGFTESGNKEISGMFWKIWDQVKFKIVQYLIYRRDNIFLEYGINFTEDTTISFQYAQEALINYLEKGRCYS